MAVLVKIYSWFGLVRFGLVWFGLVGYGESALRQHPTDSTRNPGLDQKWSRVDQIWSRVDHFWSRVDHFWSNPGFLVLLYVEELIKTNGLNRPTKT